MKPIQWSDVCGKWREGEDNPGWRDFYRENGFRNWEDWRWPIIKTLNLDRRFWHLEELKNPALEVRAMFINALTPWKKLSRTVFDGNFGDLSAHPFFKQNENIDAIKSNFYNDSQLIGLRNDGKTILVDGHTRAIALSQMTHLPPKEQPRVNLAVSDVGSNEEDWFYKLWIGDIELRLKHKAFDAIGIARSLVGAVTNRITFNR